MRFTQAQVDAIEAAIGVAYDCTPADDHERGEMESHAWKALEMMKSTLAIEPRPQGLEAATACLERTRSALNDVACDPHMPLDLVKQINSLVETINDYVLQWQLTGSLRRTAPRLRLADQQMKENLEFERKMDGWSTRRTLESDLREDR